MTWDRFCCCSPLSWRWSASKHCDCACACVQLFSRVYRGSAWLTYQLDLLVSQRIDRSDSARQLAHFLLRLPDRLQLVGIASQQVPVRGQFLVSQQRRCGCAGRPVTRRRHQIKWTVANTTKSSSTSTSIKRRAFSRCFRDANSSSAGNPGVHSRGRQHKHCLGISFAHFLVQSCLKIRKKCYKLDAPGCDGHNPRDEGWEAR